MGESFVVEAYNEAKTSILQKNITVLLYHVLSVLLL